MTRDAREPLPDDVATLRAMLLERERELQAMEDRIAIRERDLRTLSNQIESQARTIAEIERDRETLALKSELQSQTIAEPSRRQNQLEHRIGQLLKQLTAARASGSSIPISCFCSTWTT